MAGAVEWNEASWPEDELDLDHAAAIPTAGSYIIRCVRMSYVFGISCPDIRMEIPFEYRGMVVGISHLPLVLTER